MFEEKEVVAAGPAKPSKEDLALGLDLALRSNRTLACRKEESNRVGRRNLTDLTVFWRVGRRNVTNLTVFSRVGRRNFSGKGDGGEPLERHKHQDNLTLFSRQKRQNDNTKTI